MTAASFLIGLAVITSPISASAMGQTTDWFVRRSPTEPKSRSVALRDQAHWMSGDLFNLRNRTHTASVSYGVGMAGGLIFPIGTLCQEVDCGEVIRNIRGGVFRGVANPASNIDIPMAQGRPGSELAFVDSKAGTGGLTQEIMEVPTISAEDLEDLKRRRNFTEAARWNDLLMQNWNAAKQKTSSKDDTFPLHSSDLSTYRGRLRLIMPDTITLNNCSGVVISIEGRVTDEISPELLKVCKDRRLCIAWVYPQPQRRDVWADFALLLRSVRYMRSKMLNPSVNIYLSGFSESAYGAGILGFLYPDQVRVVILLHAALLPRSGAKAASATSVAAGQGGIVDFDFMDSSDWLRNHAHGQIWIMEKNVEFESYGQDISIADRWSGIKNHLILVESKFYLSDYAEQRLARYLRNLPMDGAASGKLKLED